MTTMSTTTRFNGALLPPNAVSELLQLIRNQKLSSSFEFIRSIAWSLDNLKEELLAGGEQAAGFDPLADLTTEDINFAACKFINDIVPTMVVVGQYNARFTIRPVEAAHALGFFLADWTATNANDSFKNYEDNDMLDENDEDWEDEEMGEEESYDDLDSDEEMDDADGRGAEDHPEIIASTLDKFYQVFSQVETIEHLTDEQFKKHVLQPIQTYHTTQRMANEVVSMLKQSMYAYVVMTLCRHEN